MTTDPANHPTLVNTFFQNSLFVSVPCRHPRFTLALEWAKGPKIFLRQTHGGHGGWVHHQNPSPLMSAPCRLPSARSLRSAARSGAGATPLRRPAGQLRVRTDTDSMSGHQSYSPHPIPWFTLPQHPPTPPSPRYGTLAMHLNLTSHPHPQLRSPSTTRHLHPVLTGHLRHTFTRLLHLPLPATPLLRLHIILKIVPRGTLPLTRAHHSHHLSHFNPMILMPLHYQPHPPNQPISCMQGSTYPARPGLNPRYPPPPPGSLRCYGWGKP